MSATRYIAKCKTCRLASSALATGPHLAAQGPFDPMPLGVVHLHYRTGSVVILCRGCGEPRYAKPVRGVYSARHVCSSKCMASTGTVCECSCAGKNHGGAYAAA